MARHSGVHKCNRSNCWKEGKEALSLDIPEDLRVVLKELARKSGMSFSQFVSIALEDCIRKDIKLEDSIRKMATLASGEEFNRVGDISEPVRSPLPKNKGEKGF